MSYLVENLHTSCVYRVENKKPVSLETVWDSQKYMFSPGSKVKITDPFGNYMIFTR